MGGRAYYICSACHQAKYEAVPANGHKWDSGKVTKAAGCETVGEMTYTCSVCSAKRTEAIAATGHSYANGKPQLSWKAVTGADKYYVYC